MSELLMRYQSRLAQWAQWLSTAWSEIAERYFATDGAEGVAVHAEAGAYVPGARTLPRSLQWRMVGGLSGATLLLALIIWGMTSLFTQPAAALSTGATSGAAATSFMPTPAQLSSLVIKPVAEKSFAPVVSTEGSIASDDDLTTPVFSQFSGRVTRLVAKLGDQVKKGEPLLFVEASEFVQAQNDLITAVSGLHSTGAQLALAKTNENREHLLYDSRGAALKDWQQSQSDLATAEGNYRTATIALTAVRNRLRIFGKSDGEIAAMERAPSIAHTSPEVVLSAPIDGTVILRQVGLGQYIQSSSSNPVFSISNLSTVWLVANVRETDAPLIHVGDPVNVRVLAYPGRTFAAKVSYVAPAIDPTTHRLLVRADVANPDGVLKPQMFASFDIVTGQERASPAVPQSAIIYEGDQARIWVELRNGQLGLRKLQLGRSEGDVVEALSGVKKGERIVTGGAIFIDRAATPE
jgi:cobalt-zinc-cadmium efflux system membrane fusion protein